MYVCQPPRNVFALACMQFEQKTKYIYPYENTLHNMVLVAEGRKYITENPTGGQACSKYTTKIE